EVVDAFGVGLFVDAVERSDPPIFEIVGYALVRREHEFFNQAVGDIALRARDALHHSEFVKLNHRFGEIEIDRSAAFALAVQDHRQIAHAFEVLDLSSVFAARGGVRFNDGVHGGVGHAIGGTNHAFVDFVGDDFALVVDLHGAGEHQAVDLRAETANVGREFERQHGDGAVGKIDAGAAQTGFPIERRVGSHVVGYVGDVDLQFVVAIFQLADVDGIVEIARGFAIDGDNRKLAGIAAGTQGFGRDVGGNGLGFFDHCWRKAVGQVKLADHDLDIDAEVVFFAECFDYAATRVLRGAWPVGDFHVDDYAFQIPRIGVNCGFVADDAVDSSLVGARRPHDSRRGRRRYILGRVLHSRRNDDFLGNFFVDGFDVVVAVSVVEDADHGGMGTREGAEDAAFGAAIGADGRDFDQDAVAVHGGSDGGRRNEDIAGKASLQISIERIGFGNDKAETVAMHGQAADKRVATHQASGFRWQV